MVFGALAVSILVARSFKPCPDPVSIEPTNIDATRAVVPQVPTAAAVMPTDEGRAAIVETPYGTISLTAPTPVAYAPYAATVRPDVQESGRKTTKGVLVFVIDDVGYNTRQLDAFLDFPGPLTIAILPGLPYTRAAADMAKRAGKEIILHQPMEAITGLNSGLGSIGPVLGEDEIRGILRSNLAQVPGAVGMNNHMGSKATQDVRTMSIVLDEVRRAGIYFLDSLTIGDSVVHSVASLMKQPAWERTVFLDNSPDRASIIKYVNEGLKVAEKRGYAVMIGHVWSAELAQTLVELYPGLMEQGFSLSTISRIMMDTDDEDSGY